MSGPSIISRAKERGRLARIGATIALTAVVCVPGALAAATTSGASKPQAVAAHPVAAPHIDINLPPVDSALLSVLKDIAKTAGSQDELDKIEDPAQKAAVKSALEALDFAVAHAQVGANRIVAGSQKDKLEKSLTAESWESGLVPLSGDGQASLSVLWAKKVDGLVNVTVAGNCDCKGAAPHIGEYAVVFNGKTVVDSGFDIQSQNDVSFWLGKLTSVTVDATKCGDAQTTAESSVPELKALMTADRARRMAAKAQREKAAKAAQELVAREQAKAALEQVVKAQSVNPGEITPAPVPQETPALAVQPAARPLEAAAASAAPQGNPPQNAASQSAASQSAAPQNAAPSPGLMFLPELKPPMNVPDHPAPSN